MALSAGHSAVHVVAVQTIARVVPASSTRGSGILFGREWRKKKIESYYDSKKKKSFNKFRRDSRMIGMIGVNGFYGLANLANIFLYISLS